MKTIYRSEKGKEEILNLYDSQLSRLKTPWKDVYADTSFGKTHIIETGNMTGKLSIDYIKVKTGMPGNVDEELMKRCKAPTLVMAAERDCLFPGKGVIERAKKIIPNCRTCLLEGRGHMNFLTEDEKKMIVDFLVDE